MTFAISPRNLLTVSAALLALAALFGLLNANKNSSLRDSVAQAISARDTANQQRVSLEKALKTHEANASTANRSAEPEGKTAQAEAEFVKIQADKAALQTKLQESEAQIAALQRRIDEMTSKPSANPGAPSVVELQAQLDDARDQLDAAEREKFLLSEKIQGTTRERPVQVEEDKKRREVVSQRTGVRGTVLAVNQAYNFVVLNLGSRQGIESNSEMLVLRAGTLIGKIRVSSVEPSTAIGDIISGSLARGVQVQPGDTVIYAGNS